MRSKSNKIRKLTKIVATISDFRCDADFLRHLYEGGVNVVRINTAHQDVDAALKVVQAVRSVSSRLAIMIDTKGPEVRTRGISAPIQLEQGDKIYLAHSNYKEKRDFPQFQVSYDPLIDKMDVGERIYIDDADIALRVLEKHKGQYLLCIAENTGLLKMNKSINVPSIRLGLPTLTAKDEQFIRFAVEQNIDFIAHSFVRGKEDVQTIQAILDKYKSSVRILSKIENQQGIDNIDEILEVSYGIMIARGDMGIEVDPAKIPTIQKDLIAKCRECAKPVITATQMLHTMIDNPRPTRAEISDIANAIYDGTDAVMLSGETANGSYPLEAVRFMTNVAQAVEEAQRLHMQGEILDLPYRRFKEGESITKNQRSFLCKVAAESAYHLPIKKLVLDTRTGRSARIIASYRPPIEVHVVSSHEQLNRSLELSYGVYAHFIEADNKNDLVIQTLSMLKMKGEAEDDDQILFVYGTPKREESSEIIEINTVKKAILGRLD